MPVERLRKVKTYLVTELNQRAELIQTICRLPVLIGTANIDNKATVILQLTVDQPSKLTEPVNVFSLIFIAVCLLSLQGKRRGGYNQIDAAVFQRP